MSDIKYSKQPTETPETKPAELTKPEPTEAAETKPTETTKPQSQEKLSPAGQTALGSPLPVETSAADSSSTSKAEKGEAWSDDGLTREQRQTLIESLMLRQADITKRHDAVAGYKNLTDEKKKEYRDEYAKELHEITVELNIQRTKLASQKR